MPSTSSMRKSQEFQQLMEVDSIEATRVIGEAIVSIDESMKKLLSSGLNMNGLVTLLCDDCKMPKKQVMRVLVSLQNLKAKYTGTSVARKFRSV